MCTTATGTPPTTGTGTTTDGNGTIHTVYVHPGFHRVVADWQALSTS